MLASEAHCSTASSFECLDVFAQSEDSGTLFFAFLLNDI